MQYFIFISLNIAKPLLKDYPTELYTALAHKSSTAADHLASGCAILCHVGAEGVFRSIVVNW
jgi:hypothetical protein